MRRRLVVGLILGAALLAVAFGRAGGAPPQGFVGRIDLKSLAVEGLSALWLSADGRRFIALSDRSFAISGTIERDSIGRPLSATVGHQSALNGPNGAIDSEGLAISAKADIFVSTEGPARVFSFETLDMPGKPLARPRDFGPLPPNGALEALAVGPDDALFTIPETADTETGLFPLYSNQSGDWLILAHLQFPDGFLPVSADVGPDGRLYILLRAFSPMRGFATRLQRFDLATGTPGPAQDLIDAGFGQLGNAEGLSVWRDASGRLIATLVTDDNGNFFQTAALTEFALPD